MGSFLAAAGVVGEVACPSDEGEKKISFLAFMVLFHLTFLSNSFLCPGKETSKEVVVTGGRLVGASAIVLGVAFVVKKYF